MKIPLTLSAALVNSQPVQSPGIITVCAPPKTGSKTMHSFLDKRCNSLDDDTYGYWTCKVDNSLDQDITWVHTRNPLARLLSAYEDKAEIANNQYSNYFVQQKFKKRMRSKSGNYKFDHRNDGKEKHMVVTFKDFLESLLNNRTWGRPQNWDRHWQPMSMICPHSSDILTKTENMTADLKEVDQYLFKNDVPERSIRKNQKRLDTWCQEAPTETGLDLCLVVDYLKLGITMDLLDRIRDRYNDDFLNGGYDLLYEEFKLEYSHRSNTQIMFSEQQSHEL